MKAPQASGVPEPPAVRRNAMASTEGEAPDESGRGRDFPCPQCGSNLTYAIGALELHCGHCGFRREIELDPDVEIDENDYQRALEQLATQRTRRADAADANETLAETVVCEACAAEVTFEGAVTSMDCAYCGTPLQREEIHMHPDRIPVDGVLPFAVDRKAAQGALTRWVKGLWFAPNAFKRKGLRGDFHGVYLPFWTFDSLTFTQFKGQRGDSYWEGSGKNRRRRTRWRRVRGSFQHFFDDVLVLAAQRVRAMPMGRFLERLEPWPTKDLRPFQAEFLAGFQARTYDTRLEDGFSDAHRRMQEETRRFVRRRIGGDSQRIENIATRFDAVTYKHVLLPLWLMTYRHQGEEKQVVINAITGKVFGERPYSWVKIAFTVLSVVMVLLLMILFGGE